MRSIRSYRRIRFEPLEPRLMLAVVELPGEAAFRDIAGFGANTLPANDDESSALVTIGFEANFFGTSYSQLYVNNNGNVTFNNSLSAFTPENLLQTQRVIIAPFWADVDTREIGTVTYGQDVIQGHNVFGVNWTNVGYYSSNSDKTNTFQLVLIDRSDISPGDFDFEFNYTTLEWETGDHSSSGGVNGLGGNSARAGYSNGTNTAFELPGSDVDGAFLDANPLSGLIYNNRGTVVAGRYRFQVRNGLLGPTALDDVASTPSGVPATIDVLANDIAFGAGVDPTSVTIVDLPAHGVAAVDPGTGIVTYTPAVGFTGQDSFSYFVFDTQGGPSNVARVTIDVTGIIEAPQTPVELIVPPPSPIDAPLVPPPPPQPSLLLVLVQPQTGAVPSVEYGTNGYIPQPQTVNTASASVPAAIDAALASDEIDEAFLLAGFLDFVDPEMLVVDLGDEPPAQVASDSAKMSPTGERSVAEQSTPAEDESAAKTGAAAVEYMKPPVDGSIEQAAVDGGGWPWIAFAVDHWRWFASIVGALLLAGAAWKSRYAWLHAARKLWVR